MFLIPAILFSQAGGIIVDRTTDPPTMTFPGDINLTSGGEIKYGDFSVCFTVNYSDSSPKELYTVADGYIIDAVHIEVTTTWNDGAKAFEVGDDTDPNGFIEDLGADLGATGYYGFDHDEWGEYLWHVAGSHDICKIYSGADTIDATFTGTGDGGSQGVCIVCIHVRRMK